MQSQENQPSQADGGGASSDDYDEEIHLHTQLPDVAFVTLPSPADFLPPPLSIPTTKAVKAPPFVRFDAI